MTLSNPRAVARHGSHHEARTVERGGIDSRALVDGYNYTVFEDGSVYNHRGERLFFEIGRDVTAIMEAKRARSLPVRLVDTPQQWWLHWWLLFTHPAWYIDEDDPISARFRILFND